MLSEVNQTDKDKAGCSQNLWPYNKKSKEKIKVGQNMDSKLQKQKCQEMV